MARAPKRLVVGDVRARVDSRRGSKLGKWYWRAVYYANKGNEHAVWSGWATRDEAERAIAKVVEAGTYKDKVPKEVRPPENPTVRDLLETWVAAVKKRTDLSEQTRRVYRQAARRLLRVLDGVLLDRLDATTLAGFRDRCLAADLATWTIEHDLVVLSQAWTWGRERGVAPNRDLPRTPVQVRPKKPKYTPTRDEILRVLEQLDGWTALGFRLLYATGARIGDVGGLTWRDVDLDDRSVRFADDNAEGFRVVPIIDDALVEILKCHRGLPDRSVFGVTPESFSTGLRSALHGKGYTQGGERKRFVGAIERAGVREFSPHALRRFAVDELARAGVDAGAACAITGHSAVTMLKHYRQATAEDKRNAVAKARLGVVPGGKVIEIGRRDEPAQGDLRKQ